ncbi:MAG: tRNA (adenosine(37)-N6)-threonylcarbamoyltransferase complex ATPase subunit type 1 TsaE [Rhodospirillales bacterium]|nr:tRNA (adenosine(37)-N6)-threonylcarbamoyltransferase complex ATPase subunit type 1 TsaE [Rhodospirillales bacterium]MCB9997110.1 tRNA (adenosine(37)-N6)-threonylcarbamoyltransferase complex ATPase subunit type 1 TsaE [Rhodospirillales bacterium]
MIKNLMRHLSTSEDDTARIASDLAAQLTPGDVLCLRGDLGMGKSVFARALIRALANNPALEVPSPTFTLVQTYDTAQGPLWHFDLYRIEDEEEIYELGWEEALCDAITLIEWPQRAENALPPDRLDIIFAPLENEPNHREIRLIPSKSCGGTWTQRRLP